MNHGRLLDRASATASRAVRRHGSFWLCSSTQGGRDLQRRLRARPGAGLLWAIDTDPAQIAEAWDARCGACALGIGDLEGFGIPCVTTARGRRVMSLWFLWGIAARQPAGRS